MPVSAMTPYLGVVARHGLTALSMLLVARGLPGLDDSTVANLSSVAAGVLGMGISAGWGLLQHYITRNTPNA